MNEILISNDFKPKAILLNILISADCCAESNTELCPGFIPLFRSEDMSVELKALITWQVMMNKPKHAQQN
jgi:hypothetical protein